MGWTNTGKRAKPERKPELVIPEGGKPGQVLVMTEKGPEWQDRRMAAQLKRDGEDDRLYCDKTFNELYDAYNRGVDVQIEVDSGYNMLLYPIFVSKQSIIFSATSIDKGVVVGQEAIVSANNQWTFSETEFNVPEESSDE